MPKHTTPQRTEIKRLVLEAYIQGAGPGDILQFLAEKKKYLISRRQLEYYLAEAKKELKAKARFDRDEQLGKAISRLESLYRRSQSKEKRTALAVQKEINLVCGLVTHQVEHQGKVTFERWLSGAGEDEVAGEGGQGNAKGSDTVKSPEKNS